MRPYLHTAVASVLVALTAHGTSARAQDSTVQRRALLCDPSLAEAAEARHHRSQVFAGVTTVASLALPAVFLATGPSRSGRWIPVAFAGTVAARTISMHMQANTADQPAAWDDVLERFRGGETRIADVRACLGSPSSVSKQLVGADSAAGSRDETWIYSLRQASFIPLTGSTRTVTITFRGGLLTSVRKTETRR